MKKQVKFTLFDFPSYKNMKYLIDPLKGAAPLTGVIGYTTSIKQKQMTSEMGNKTSLVSLYMGYVTAFEILDMQTNKLN